MNTRTTRFGAFVKKGTSAILFTALVLSVSSCSQKILFLVSSVVPSAEGSVKIKSDKNANYIIDLKVIRLVEPSRLTPPKLGYSVWAETEGNGVKNLGHLNTSAGLLSNTLKSSLTTVTPFKPTHFFITAEDNLTPQYPGAIVLKTGTFSLK
jgi:hypothetical protein